MIDIHPNMTVRDLVVKAPYAKRALEMVGIDYCCGGLKSLAAALQEKDLTVEALLARIQAAEADARASGAEIRDWTKATATELARHILDAHHAFMKREMPRIEGLFAKVLKAHGAKHGKILGELRDIFLSLKEEIGLHLQKEEQILFPYIEELDAVLAGKGSRPDFHCGTIQNPIRVMLEEHDHAGAALAKMSGLTGHYTPPPDGCPTFAELYRSLHAVEDDLHEHVHLENNFLFPQAIELERRMTGA